MLQEGNIFTDMCLITVGCTVFQFFTKDDILLYFLLSTTELLKFIRCHICTSFGQNKIRTAVWDTSDILHIFCIWSKGSYPKGKNNTIKVYQDNGVTISTVEEIRSNLLGSYCSYLTASINLHSPVLSDVAWFKSININSQKTLLFWQDNSYLHDSFNTSIRFDTLTRSHPSLA